MRLLTLLALLATAILVGCVAPRPAGVTPGPSPASSTSTNPDPGAAYTVTPTPDRTPVVYPRTWDAPPKSGITEVDTIITAIVTGDAALLARHIEPTMTPCVAGTGDPRCPDGVRAGTPIPSFFLSNGGRGDWWIRIAETEPSPGSRGSSTTSRGLAEGLIRDAPRLGAVLRPGPAPSEAREQRGGETLGADFEIYVAYRNDALGTDSLHMTNGLVLLVRRGRIIGFASSARHPGDLALWYHTAAARGTVLIAPRP